MLWLHRSIHKALKKGGKLVVIDFHRDDSKIWSKPKGWVTEHVRASQSEFRKEIESAGFRLVAEPTIAGLTENYCMVFEPV
jgi:predicted methyltransferase